MNSEDLLSLKYFLFNLDKVSGGVWILSKNRLSQIYTEKQLKKKNKLPYEVLEEFGGDKLVGLEYVPLFDYFHSVREFTR